MNAKHNLPSQPPSAAKAVRVGPGQHGKPAALFWKFWTEKSEIYATSRGGGHLTKISVHASGQVHMHIGPRNLQHMAPPMPMGSGQWLHAVEVRFLLGPGAFLPPAEMVKLKKKSKALLIEVPPEQVLVLNLLVGKAGEAPSASLPDMLRGARPIWQTALQDGRAVVLVARVLAMDQQNAAAIKFIRSELNPKVNLAGKPTGQLPYIEIMHAFWSAGGNVMLVIPMGAEGHRFDEDADADMESAASDARSITISCPDSSIPILAPDGVAVGTLAIVGATSEILLVKNKEVVGLFGTITLSIDPAKLRLGETFTRPRVGIVCIPTIGGARPRTWEYPINVSFDGEILTAEIGQQSAALRNSNLSTPLVGLEPSEELLVRAPVSEVSLRSSRTDPNSSAALGCGFRLRNV
jgi:hypothetical protein